jgi:hypothetical protein
VPGPAEYLRFLAANGYALSAIEQVITGECAPPTRSMRNRHTDVMPGGSAGPCTGFGGSIPRACLLQRITETRMDIRAGQLSRRTTDPFTHQDHLMHTDIQDVCENPPSLMTSAQGAVHSGRARTEGTPWRSAAIRVSGFTTPAPRPRVATGLRERLSRPTTRAGKDAAEWHPQSVVGTCPRTWLGPSVNSRTRGTDREGGSRTAVRR